MTLKEKQLYSFDSFVLNPAEHLLLNNGEAVSITPKTFDLLFTLVKHAGELLSKDALMKTVWPTSFVDESNLTQHISMARKALGEAPGKPLHIITVPARGYRFATKVRVWSEPADEVSAPVDAEPEAPVVSPAASAQGKVGRWVWVVAAAAMVLISVAVAMYRQRPARASKARTLAILPFRNLRNDPDSDFLGFSLADAVIYKLGSVRSINVRPSSSVEKYKAGNVSFAEATSALHADTLLTGAFQRDGDDLRITYQLVDVKSEQILWQGRVDFKYKKLLSVQDSVAQQIVSRLAVSISAVESARLKEERKIDPMAYEYFLRAVSMYSQNEFSLATQMLTKSIEIDSEYAPAWAQLGRTYTASGSLKFGGTEEYKKARAAYERSLALDPEGLDVKIYFANFLTDSGQVEQAVPLLRKALAQKPDHAEAHWELGYAYRFAGMLKESVAECERARQLDPGVKINNSAPNGYLYLGNYAAFLERLPKNSDSAFILFYRGMAELYMGKREQAALDFDKAYEADASLLHARIGKSLAYSLRQNTTAAAEMLKEAELLVAKQGVTDPEAIYKISQGYAVLGDRRAALRVMRRSVDGGFFCYPYLQNDPLFVAYRKDDEFQRILKDALRRHAAFRSKFL